MNGLGQLRANGRAHGGGPTARRLAEEGEARARGGDGGQHRLRCATEESGHAPRPACFFSFLQARGQLGHGDQQEQQLPKEIAAFAGRRVVAVSAVVPTTASPPTALAVWSWGYGFFGRLGLATKENQLLPKKIEAFAGRRVIAVLAEAATTSPALPTAPLLPGEREDGCLGHGEDL